MPYNQRDLVWLKDPLPLPDGTKLPHPVLIISCNAANSREKHYTGVMMTSSAHRDLFSFEVDDTMFERPLPKKGCQFRLYIICVFTEANIDKLENKMIKIHFTSLMKQIKDYVFSID